MDPIEIRARREALGLSQNDLAPLLGVAQNTLSQWEGGTRAPRDPITISMALYELEQTADDVLEGILDPAEQELLALHPKELTLRTYWDDQTWWTAQPGAQGLPASMHRAATARAAWEIGDQHGIPVSIVAE